MTREEKYAYWLQIAQYDLDTAETMFTGGRWFYVVFMCQQALEKLCKGLYNFYIDDDVPRVHNIPFILAKIETSLPFKVEPEINEFLDNLSSYYLYNRYPNFPSLSNIHIDKNKAEETLDKTKEVFVWLLTLKQ